jgi:hypothetical protein
MEYKKPNWFKIFCKVAWKDLKFILIGLAISAVFILCILSLIHYPVYTLTILFLVFGVGKWIKKTNKIAASDKRDCCRSEIEAIERIYRDPANKIFDIYMKKLEVPSDLEIEKYKTYKENYYKEVKRVLEYYHLTEDDIYIRPVYKLIISGKEI